MVMRAGRLNHLVDIQAATAARNEYGEEVLGWAAIAGGVGVWAGIEPLRGREYFEATQQHTDISVRIVIRYLSGVTAKMRIQHGVDVYEIVEPPIDKSLKRETLELMCRRVDPEATP